MALPRLASAFLLLYLAICSAAGQDKKRKDQEVEADTLVAHEDFAKAVLIYSRIISQSKTQDSISYRALYKRAICYYSLDDFQAALGDLNIFVPRFPGRLEARALRAFVYKSLGETDRQIADLDSLIAVHPGVNLFKWRAAAYLDKEDFAAAKKDLLQVKSVADDADTEVSLGMAYYGTGQPDSALTSLNKAIEFDPTSLPAYLYAASFCLQEEAYELAVKYLDVALSVEPGNVTALYYKGVALVEAGKTDEGCRCLTKAFHAGEDEAGDYLKEFCYGSDN